MTVYVDDMYLTSMGQYRGMKMSHMVADTEQELFDMALKIGIQLKWYQQPPRVRYSHFDISLSMRQKAVLLGAKEVTMKELLVLSKKMMERKMS